ncbi:PA14 domain-containing protein [Burkholderia pseudomultivorans]|uniref:Carbohydrate-binding protein n=1 Tax=Burkholderia pseudomultivorans TaxID=1207504 RepID=A0A132E966_9BURK|nr:PA14 domain-containing protein [Burkholderia pseudomultivorans]KWF21916.1 carbohydrate-binding protein [Burkholderia pseudomultivorans]
MTITSRLKPAALAVVVLLASCGGDDSSAPSASLLAARASVDASSSASAAATAANTAAAAADVANAMHGGGPTHFPNQPITLGLPGPTPALRVSAPAVAPFVPAAPPAALDTQTLTLADFDTYGPAWTSSGANTIQIAGTSQDGAKLVTNAQHAAYGHASYEADVTIGAPAPGAGTANAGFIVHVTDPTVGTDALTGYYIGLDAVRHVVQVGREQNNWTDFIDYPAPAVVAGSTHHLKVVTRNNAIDVYLDGTQTISINDATSGLTTALRAGAFGLRRFGASVAFGNVTVSRYPDVAPATYDFSRVVGAVYNPWNAVNAIDFWENYDPATVDRELDYAQTYGMNTITVYLHYLNWVNDRVAFLAKFDSLLDIAARHGLKVAPIFYDDCWHTDPAWGPQAAPIFGVHNSRWVQSPGLSVEQQYLQPVAAGASTTYKQDLQHYIADFVSAHRNDPRILYWEPMNEPGCSGNGALQPTRAMMMNDARIAILGAGATQPINSPNVQEPEGDYFSDFHAFHPYAINATTPDYSLPPSLLDSLNSETLQRGWPGGQAGQTMAGIASTYGGKTGFLVWELMIGRTNTRFHWRQTASAPATVEPATPFQGTLYPDGHPWSTAEVQALASAFGSRLRVLNATYYNDTTFTTPVFSSITPLVDFDLNTERGTDSPDASKGINATNYAIRWTGALEIPKADNYTFSVTSDNVARVWIDGQKVIDKAQPGLATVKGRIRLSERRNVPIRVEYVHGSGAASMHLQWSSPGASRTNLVRIAERPLTDALAQ